MQIEELEQRMRLRIAYLEKQAQRHLFVLDLLASLGELQYGASMRKDPARIFGIAREHLKPLVDFDVLSFFMVDESSSEFVLMEFEPESESARIQEEINVQIDNGTFAWALNQNRPVIVKSRCYEKTLILHVLATKSRTRGMFAGVVALDEHQLSDSIIYPLSIIVQNTANALESAALYKLISEQNQGLEEMVRSRTIALEEQAVHLKEEIAYRQLAEESLVVAMGEAESAAKAKGEFLANISHEIRTPMNAILGYCEILQYESKKHGYESFFDDLKSIESAGKHLLGLINDILDLSKIQSGMMELDEDTFKISEMIEDVAGTIRPLASKRVNVFEVRCPENIGNMRADAMRVRQVLLNLISNSCKFTEEGKIILAVERFVSNEAEWIKFSVSDTGVGIKPEQMGKIFNEFTQADASTTRKYGGTGLGLPISRRLCVMMGGDIQVQSQYGKGATFIVIVPSGIPLGEEDGLSSRNVDADAARHTRQLSSQSEALAKPEIRESANIVLVIDDEPVTLELMLKFLGKEGFHLVTASNADTGIQMAKDFMPALIIVNAMMKPDGWAVLKTLQSRSDLNQIPVIAFSQASEREKALSMGAVECLVKPVDWDFLMALLTRYGVSRLPTTVLLVEDDAISREMMSRILTREGLTVVSAVNGLATLECVRKERPRMILLDLKMPEMDGFELIAELRKNKEWASIPIVVLTAMELNREDYLRLSEAKVVVFQKGTCSKNELLEEVRKSVGYAKQ